MFLLLLYYNDNSSERGRVIFFFYDIKNPEDLTTEDIRSKLAELKVKAKEFETLMQPPENALFATDKQSLEASGNHKKVMADIEQFEAILFERKTFKKAPFIENFKALTTKTGIKIGMIETEANVAPGYLSRLDKEGNTSDPSVEFVATAARMLDVSIDQLLFGKIEKLSQTESYLNNFFQMLISDTVSDVMTWNLDRPPVEHYVSENDYPDAIGHPLYVSEWNDYKKRYDVFYSSQFEKNVKVSSEVGSYIAVLPNTNSYVYIMACSGSKGDGSGKMDKFYECYIADERGVTPICSSHNACETIKRDIDALYKEIEKSAKRVHISPSAVLTIDRYMRRNDEAPFS